MKDQNKKPANARRNRKARQAYAVKKTTVSAPVKTYVARQIDRNAETKYVSQQPYSTQSGLMNKTNFTAGITSNAECYAVIPPVTQGQGDHERIGNIITPKSLKVKGFVSLIGNQTDSFWIDVDIWILTSKTLKSQYQESSLDMNSLLNAGNGLNTQYDGSFLNSTFPINTSLFTVLRHKKIRLTKPYGNMNTAICGGSAEVVANYSSEKFSSLFNFDVPLPAKLKYDLDVQTIPSNYYPFMVIGYNVPANCDASGIGNTNTVMVTANSCLYFKDS